MRLSLSARSLCTISLYTALAAAGVGGLTATAAQAAVVVRYDLPALVTDADLIVTGRVIEAVGQWRGGRIVTRYTVRCDEIVKGAPRETVTVEVPGGTVDGLGQMVPGVPKLVEAEQVVLFLKPGSAVKGDLALKADAQQIHTIVGLSQGKLRVEPTFDGPMVIRDLHGLTTVRRLPDGTMEEVAPALAARQPLQDFVRALVQLTGDAPR